MIGTYIYEANAVSRCKRLICLRRWSWHTTSPTSSRFKTWKTGLVWCKRLSAIGNCLCWCYSATRLTWITCRLWSRICTKSLQLATKCRRITFQPKPETKCPLCSTRLLPILQESSCPKPRSRRSKRKSRRRSSNTGAMMEEQKRAKR